MTAGQSHRVLLIDDELNDLALSECVVDSIMRRIASINLVKSGNSAIAYMIGEGSFWDRACFPFPSLVITHLHMSDGDGFDVLEFMAGNPEWAVVPRVMFSSSGHDDDVRTAYRLGASAFHIKPAGQEEFVAVIKNVVSYWATAEVPPVDKNGRLLVTNSTGRRGARFPQQLGSKIMKRPEATGQ